jgi:hypothetical protein
MLAVLIALVTSPGPVREFRVRESVRYHAKLVDRTVEPEVTNRYDITVRVLELLADERGWKVRFVFSNQESESEAAKMRRRGNFGAVEFEVGRTGVMGAYTANPANANSALPILSFFVPDAPAGATKWDRVSLPGDDEAKWSLDGAIKAVAKTWQLDGSIRNADGGVVGTTQTVIDARGWPVSASLKVGSGDRNLEFTLRR